MYIFIFISSQTASKTKQTEKQTVPTAQHLITKEHYVSSQMNTVQCKHDDDSEHDMTCHDTNNSG